MNKEAYDEGYIDPIERCVGFDIKTKHKTVPSKRRRLQRCLGERECGLRRLCEGRGRT
jgi:hypothetical protein